MAQREKAPSWVMGGLLLLLFYFSLIGFLNLLDLLPTSDWWINIPNGSANIKIIRIWWIGSVLSLIFLGTTTILSLKRKWAKPITWGSILSIVIAILWIFRLFLLWRAYVYGYEWPDDIDVLFNRIANILEMAGFIMIAIGINISKSVRIAVIVYLCVVYMIGWIPMTWTYDLNLYYSIGRPMCVIGLMLLWFYKRKNTQRQ